MKEYTIYKTILYILGITALITNFAVSPVIAIGVILMMCIYGIILTIYTSVGG